MTPPARSRLSSSSQSAVVLLINDLAQCWENALTLITFQDQRDRVGNGLREDSLACHAPPTTDHCKGSPSAGTTRTPSLLLTSFQPLPEISVQAAPPSLGQICLLDILTEASPAPSHFVHFVTIYPVLRLFDYGLPPHPNSNFHDSKDYG